MSSYRDFLKEQLKDPELKAEYDALEPEFAIIQIGLNSSTPSLRLFSILSAASFQVSMLAL